MARFVGVGYLAYFLISIPSFGQPPGLVADWFTPVGIVLAFGPGALLLAVTFVDDAVRFIPPLALLCAAGYLAAELLWFVAWTGEEAATELVTWLMSFSGLPSLAVALVRLRPAVVTLVVCGVLSGVIVTVGRAAEISTNMLGEVLWGPLFTLPFMLATWTVVRTGAVLDATRAGALRAVADSASAAARTAERSRFDALIHDRVIATLVATKQSTDERLPGQARAALDELAILAGETEDDDSLLTVDETVARLRTMATSIEADIAIGHVRDDRVDARVPRYRATVIRAVAEAMGEALRNSVRHAGSAAERAIMIEPSADAILVTVADNGAGFDVDRVPPERLGIEVSIRGRIADLPGGSAQVRSAPGSGTTVQIRWEAP